MSTGAEILDGVWRFTAIHPDWTEDDESWEPEVAWHGIQTELGLLLVDPLVDGWEDLDALTRHCGGCAGIVRTVHWHHRSVAAAAERYAAQVWARPAPPGVPAHPFDREVVEGVPLPGDVLPFKTPRDDEIVLWSGPHRALVFGDVMLRDDDGVLHRCPDSWIARDGGPERLREGLRELLELPAQHVLVAHGPVVLGDASELARALGE